MIRITANQDIRKFKAGDSFEFNEFPTLVVGKNGCGKSTIFHAVRGFKDDAKTRSLNESDFRLLSMSFDVEHDYERIFHYDSVKDSGTDMMNAYDAAAYISSGGFATRNSSHGETQLVQFDMFMKRISDKIIPGKTLLILDEMDKGFGLWFAAKFRSMVKHISAKHGLDVIAITHNLMAILQSEKVYSVPLKQYVPSDVYVTMETGLFITIKDAE